MDRVAGYAHDRTHRLARGAQPTLGNDTRETQGGGGVHLEGFVDDGFVIRQPLDDSDDATGSRSCPSARSSFPCDTTAGNSSKAVKSTEGERPSKRNSLPVHSRFGRREVLNVCFRFRVSVGGHCVRLGFGYGCGVLCCLEHVEGGSEGKVTDVIKREVVVP